MTDRLAKRTATAIVAATAMLVAALCLWRVFTPVQPHVEVDRSRYPVCGIDISRHNGDIDFDSVAAAGIDFVYIKASEGTSHRDIAYRRNAIAASEAGMPVGAYHFFRFECDGRRQAVNFLSALSGTRPELPLAIDIEEWGNPAEVATNVVVERIAAMRAILENAGYRTVIYTNKNGYRRFVEADDAELWICSFTNPPLPHGRWRLWQHSHRARVPGIRGYVDLNTFNGSRADFRSWMSSEFSE